MFSEFCMFFTHIHHIFSATINIDTILLFNLHIVRIFSIVPLISFSGPHPNQDTYCINFHVSIVAFNLEQFLGLVCVVFFDIDTFKVLESYFVKCPSI